MSILSTKRLVTDAVLIAMYAVMATFLTLNLGGMNISVGALPIIVGAALFGPVDGLIIGLCGSFLNQIYAYGITPTTILWMIPAGVRGLMIGAFAKRCKFDMTVPETGLITIASSLAVTVLNTAAMYLDSKIWGYYSAAYVFGKIIPRTISGIITAIIFGVIVSKILPPLRYIVGNGSARTKFSVSADNHTSEYMTEDIGRTKYLSAICYLSLVFVIIALLVDQKSKFLRYHINQAIILDVFVIVCGIISIIPLIGRIISVVGLLVAVILKIIGIINACNGQAIDLPAIGRYKIIH